jgi:magnesium transporter
MTVGEYAIRQLHSPTPEDFAKALADVGLEWPWDHILERHRHPGMRASDGTLGIVLHALEFDLATDTVGIVQSIMVLGLDAGVVARWDGDHLDEALASSHATRGELIEAVMEAVHDAAADTLTDLEERVDDCELEVLDADGHGTTAQSIYHLEHELLTVRRSVGPMVALLDKLARKADDEGRDHISEWGDRYVRLVSQVEDVDNLLTSILSVNLTMVSVRQNEDMRRIAAWGAIGIVPTALAGIWGMNFRHMPELGWTVGYPLALASIVAVCLLLHRFFKKAGWL